MTDHAFWIAHEDDRTSASDGVSRYGAYVRDRASHVAEMWGEDLRAEFAAFAWRIGTGPVMAPGYVRYLRRVISAQVERNDWDGSLTANVELATGWPAALRNEHSWRVGGMYWRDWQQDHGRYVGPYGEQLTKAPFLLCTSRMLFPVPMDRLPSPPAGPYDDAPRTGARRRGGAGRGAQPDRGPGHRGDRTTLTSVSAERSRRNLRGRCFCRDAGVNSSAADAPTTHPSRESQPTRGSRRPRARKAAIAAGDLP